MIAKSTIFAVSLAFLSHFYICLLADDYWGVVAAASMGVSLVSLSIPVRYTWFDITAREAFAAGVGMSSFIFSLNIGRMVQHPKKVHGLWPMTKC